MLKYYIYDEQQEKALTIDWEEETVNYFDSYMEALKCRGMELMNMVLSGDGDTPTYFNLTNENDEPSETNLNEEYLKFKNGRETLETYKILMNDFDYSIKSIDFEKEVNNLATKININDNVSIQEKDIFDTWKYLTVETLDDIELWENYSEVLSYFINPNNYDSIINKLCTIWKTYSYESNRDINCKDTINFDEFTVFQLNEVPFN